MASVREYIKFLFQATNQHGVHSPFIYAFVTQCLYDRTRFSAYQKLKAPNRKRKRLLFRVAQYFTIQKTLSFDPAEAAILKAVFPDMTIFLLANAKENPPIDMILMGKNYDFALAQDLIKQMHNDSVLVVNNLYCSAEAIQFWQQLKNDKQVTVTVDCFDVGFAFIRHEQEKEHFKIRL